MTPLGFGRRIGGNDGFQHLLRLQAIDVLRPDLARHPTAGVRKAAALAEAYYTAVAPSRHGGPVATAAALSQRGIDPNFVIQRVPLPTTIGISPCARHRSSRVADIGNFSESRWTAIPEWLRLST